MSARTVPREVFLSYAPEDEQFGRELEKHLCLLKQEGLITVWHKGRIEAGNDWNQELHKHLSTASVMVLLLSANFLDSEECMSLEMQRAMHRYTPLGEISVIPVLLRPMESWRSTPIGSLQALPSNGVPVTTWSDTHAAWADVAQGIRSVVKDGKLFPTVAASPLLPPIWNIPYTRNPFFIEQDRLLVRLADAWKGDQATAHAQPQALSGLGGVGKTQIAVEYAYRYRQDYKAVLWTGAESRESLVSGYIALAELLNLPQKSEQDQKSVIRAVKVWLQTHDSWLLILDNADDLALVREFVPSLLGGHLLLTTRARSVGKLARRIEVETMNPDVGALFLLRRAGLIEPNASLDLAQPSDVIIARIICKELGGLPLALDRAGAYIEKIPCSLKDYLYLYRTRGVEMLKIRGEFVDDHPEAVAITWFLSFEKVEQNHPAAADLLRFCAFLHPDVIPEEMITRGASHLGPRLQEMACDPQLLDRAFAALGEYSLIRRNVEAKTLSLHRLGQVVLIDRMDEQTQREWAERTINAVLEILPKDATDHRQWGRYERCLMQALNCKELVDLWSVYTEAAFEVLYRTAWYLKIHAHCHEAEPLCERVYLIARKIWGPEHPKTAKALMGRAVSYHLYRMYKHAKPLYEEALRIYQQGLGPKHPKVAYALCHLAEVSWAQGEYGKAEPFYEEALHIYQETQGPKRPSVAYALTGLANLYREQGKYGKAESFYEEALQIYQEALGPKHPGVATLLNELATFHRVQGRYAEAELFCRQALEIYEQKLGADHPRMAMSFQNLALLSLNQGKDQDAERLFQRALAIREQALGVGHPDTANSVWWLAVVYRQQQQYERAEPLYRRAFSVYKVTLGLDHPDTQDIQQQYVLLLREMGCDEEVNALERECGEEPD